MPSKEARMEKTPEEARAETMEGVAKAKRAVATFLGIEPEQVLDFGANGRKDGFFETTIKLRVGKDFVKEFTPPFQKGDRVLPVVVPITPRDGHREDALTDDRKRTVERTWLDLNNRKWWIFLKGRKKPFPPNFFKLVPPRS
jgi:hypothetical protein